MPLGLQIYWHDQESCTVSTTDGHFEPSHITLDMRLMLENIQTPEELVPLLRRELPLLKEKFPAEKMVLDLFLTAITFPNMKIVSFEDNIGTGNVFGGTPNGLSVDLSLT